MDKQRSGSDMSVVIPTFNAARFLTDAIASVLAQDLAPLEVIVVDDGSTDDTVAVVRSFNAAVTLIRQDHSGTSAARNLGVSHAVGDLIAFCDADDLWLPGKLRAQRAVIDDVAAPMAVFCGASEFLDDRIDPAIWAGRPPKERIDMAQMSSALLVTRTALDIVGPFDVALTNEWVPWCIALTSLVEVRSVPEVLMRRRLHETNKSLQVGDRARAMPRALLERMRRRNAPDSEGECP